MRVDLAVPQAISSLIILVSSFPTLPDFEPSPLTISLISLVTKHSTANSTNHVTFEKKT